MTQHQQKGFSAGIDPDQLWYVPDRRIRTPAAAEDAMRVAEWIATRPSGEEAPTEETLFTALHTAAFRGSRRDVAEDEKLVWIQRWQEIRGYLVERNVGLVYSMLSRFHSSNVDEDDLLSDAMFGLSRAVDRFNPSRGFRFSTYACNVIARALMRRGRQESNYRRLFPVQHDVTLERVERVPDRVTQLYVERLQRAIFENLGELTDLESRILSQRFPTDQDSRLTFKEIGDAIGLSKERVRQIQNIALDKLRKVLVEDPMLK